MCSSSYKQMLERLNSDLDEPDCLADTISKNLVWCSPRRPFSETLLSLPVFPISSTLWFLFCLSSLHSEKLIVLQKSQDANYLRVGQIWEWYCCDRKYMWPWSTYPKFGVLILLQNCSCHCSLEYSLEIWGSDVIQMRRQVEEGHSAGCLSLARQRLKL